MRLLLTEVRLRGGIKMPEERRKEIEEFAKEVGLSFVDAKRMLEEIENDVDHNEAMRELWY